MFLRPTGFINFRVFLSGKSENAYRILVNGWTSENVYTHICRIKGCGGAGWPPHQ